MTLQSETRTNFALPRYRHGAALLAVVVLLTGTTVWAQNEIVTENLLAGNPPSEWEVSGAGDPSIQGFATDISVDQGSTIDFKVKTDASAYTIDIYRLGWYGGLGARKVATVSPSATLPQVQPACDTAVEGNLVDCGNWAVSASWAVPPTAVSGIYLARLVRSDTLGASHIAFIVRDDDGESQLLFQTSDTTWQAYNRWGETGVSAGYSLYEGPTGKADKVSYNRPFGTRSYPTEDWLFNAEYPMVRWLERNGYDVSYFTNVDTDRLGAEILEHDVFLSVGHDEYWSRAMRDNVEAARDAGVHLAFFSGNEVYWKVRWEDSIDGSGTPRRTLVCYKEGTLGENQCGTKCDPVADVWTGLWRSGCAFTPPADGCEPENTLTGQISWMGTTGAISVPSDYAHLPLWRDTSVAALTPGQVATFPAGTLGYEWDFEQYEEFYPAGRIRMSETQFSGETHHLSMYKAPSGALVFGAGTVQWSWGLDDVHDRGSAAPDARMQQATVNLLFDMGVPPETLQAGLTTPTPFSDATAPTSVIDFPSAGASLEVGTQVTITGTATDVGAAGVALVEVSTDGGTTWNAASGLENWTYAWTPAATGSYTLVSRAMDYAFNSETPGAGITVDAIPRVCPCTLWSDATLPAVASAADGNAVELGMKFQTDEDGYVTAVRFYKGPSNGGTHTGHVWASDGTLLGSTTFAGETATGWQEAAFDPAVPVVANTTYVVSYHAPQGGYALDEGFFTPDGVDNPPLHALADGVDGPNGVYHYGAIPGFPNATYNQSNYWVDFRFATSTVDTSPPQIVSRIPGPGSVANAVSSNVVVSFNEAIDDGLLVFELRDDTNSLVPATVSYDAPSRTATLDPTADLDQSAAYTVTVDGVQDLVGNALAGPDVWSFTTADPPPPPPDEGPGGPILVIGSAGNPFTRFPAEILRTEGFNAFTVTDISNVDATVLSAHDVVILGEMALSGAQVTLLTNWVDAGGTLVALRPDPQLAGLLGLTPAGGTLSDAYLLVDTSVPPGQGIVGETMQFHGTADLYTLSGATAVATLYSDATTATPNPAVTLIDVGSNGGQAMAFTYDLARSVVYTRQGNPAWDGQERDGTTPVRSDDLFYGAASGDPQPDWVDLSKVAIPQADEQQRLLANAIQMMSADRLPLPRFWYFPSGHKAVVVMTGDEHGTGANSVGRFEVYLAADPPGCSVADWECVRASGYIYPGAGMTDAQAVSYTALGFEVGAHVNTGCADWTPASLATDYANDLAALDLQLPSIPRQDSERTHCVVWSDWVGQAEVKLAEGIRLDMNYYFWPPGWVLDTPGMFTGSGMPMRFADLDGTMIDVFQVTTQMTDESGQSYPFTVDTLLDRALGAQGYYGAFGANMHHDSVNHAGASAIVASAQARGVPVVSGRQMLVWLDARNASTFSNIGWAAEVLSFDVTQATNALNLKGMLPVSVGGAQLMSLSRDLAPVSYTTETIKGVDYAVFDAFTGGYEANYMADTLAPVITNVSATAQADGTATISWNTDEPATSRVDYGTDAGTLDSNQGAGALVTSHSLQLVGLAPETTFHFRVTSVDAAANSATEPDPPAQPLSFLTPPPPCFIDATTSDFSLGTPGADTHVATVVDGEVVLRATEVAEFEALGLPAGWTSDIYVGTGTVSVSGGALAVDGGWAGPSTLRPAGRAVEFEAIFTTGGKQHAGFGETLNESHWAIFSTGLSGGDLQVRTNAGGTVFDLSLGASLLGAAHRYRVEWDPAEVRFYVDGGLVHTQPTTITPNMRMIASDGQQDGDALTVLWMRETPYSAAGSFQSRVFDAGGVATWDAASWVVDLPSGTAMDFFVRTGDTPAPDGSWTSFTSVAQSGDAVGGTSRYLQYRLDFSTSDTAVTPSVEEVRVACAVGPDVFPPVITDLTIVPAADGLSATVTWTTNELADSRVDYGVAPESLLDSEVEPALVLSHSVELTGLTPGTVYWLRVTSTDAATNSATEPDPPALPATFETPAPPCASVSTAAEFEVGTLTQLVSTVERGDGALILTPTEGSDFEGTSLPPGWQSSPWSGGSATVSGGQMIVNGALAVPTTLYGPGRTLECVATLQAEANQHVGFTNDFNSSLWAIFSTKNQTADLYVRTAPVGTDVNLGPGFLGSPHVFRIDWLASSVDFWIDGTLLWSQPVSIASPMRPAASDFNLDGTAIAVDWLRMGPYASSGTWESETFDAGATSPKWRIFSWNEDLPAGTSLVMAVRTGDTATPDGSWTSWADVASSGTDLDTSARYLQARATLATSDPSVTPALLDVGITCTSCSDVTPPAAISDLSSVQVTSGNPPGSITQIDVQWTPPEPGVQVDVYRHGYGDHPEYHEGAGVEPPVPADPAAALGAGWVLAYSGTDSSFPDLPPTRDFWYYVAFSTDACGNVSAASNRSAGSLSYHLADVSDGVTPGVGDNVVDLKDISFLGGHYNTGDGDALYDAVLDIGPTSTGYLDGRPLTDDVIEFEDLVLFGIAFESVSKSGTVAKAPPPDPALRNQLTWIVPAEMPAVGESFAVELWADGDGNLQGLRARLEWDGSVLESTSVDASGLLARQPNPHALFSPSPGTVDLAMLGRGQGLSGSGELIRMMFRVKAEGAPGFRALPVTARDADNQPLYVEVELDSVRPVSASLPVRTALHANVPNPFNPSTRIAFDLAKPGHVTIAVYAVNGRRVTTLVNEDRPAGRYDVVWNGTDASGRRVASNTYIVRMSTQDGDRTRRVVLLK